MLRRSSGSPIEERADDPIDSALPKYPLKNPIAPDTSHITVPDEPWGRASNEASPRARTSASWRRSLNETREKTDSTMLPTARRLGPSEQSPRRSHPTSPWSCSLLTTITAGLTLLFLFCVGHSFLHRQIDPQGCVMSTMTPTYIKLSGFDTEHSRFASKYSLHLYREEGVDYYTQDNIGLHGAPVLFLPGNAGSYKQVRSLSSEASRYFHNVVRHDPEALRAGAGALDFFMIDFNEDLAAFHGQTIIDQADYVNDAVAYILSLYQDPRRPRQDGNLPDPSSVILIGHSMGGIVARTALITPNYQSNSVNTIITMSTPHARPPLSFDGDMVHTYERVNQYWRDSFSRKWANNNPLWHTTLISFAGGGRDTMIPSDYTSLASVVPESHGFTVFTSGIPDIWTSMDHLAITWCDQFRKVLIKSLYDAIDVRRATQTKPRPQRMQVFRRWLLTGLEDKAPQTLPWTEPSVLLTLGEAPRSVISRSNNITIQRLGSQTSAQLLPLPSGDDAEGKLVTLLTNQPTDRSGNFEKMEILFCSTFPLPQGQSTLLPHEIDLSDGAPGATRLACKKPGVDAVRLPASTRTSKQAFDLTPPFTYLQYKAADVVNHQFLAVVDLSGEASNGWLVAQIAELSQSYLTADVSLTKLLSSGLHIELPASRPLMTDIKIPALHSSLIAYKLRLGSVGCGGDGELFTPLLRQHLDQPHESKYFVNVKEADISLHGVAPFMPPGLNGEQVSGLSLQLWIDPTCESSPSLSLQVDVAGSLGKLVMRYRTLLAAFPLIVVAIVLRKQFSIYDQTGVFVSFTESLDKCLRTSLPILFLSLTLFAVSATQPSSILRRGSTNETDFAQNDLFLGSPDTFFWFLVPLTGLVSIGVCIAINYAILLVTYLFSLVFASTKTHKDDRKPISPTPRRRIINTLLLLFLVAFFVPYHFAFVVACIVQLVTSTRALRHSRDSGSLAQTNFANYAHSIFSLMFWVLPLNLPVLLVWIQNLAVHWLTPFSSHHNILSITPFVLLVETLSSGNMIPRIPTRLRYITNLMLLALALFTAMYGVSHAYMLHQLVNGVALWLFLVHFARGSPINIKTLLDDDSDDAEMKKMP